MSRYLSIRASGTISIGEAPEKPNTNVTAEISLSDRAALGQGMARALVASAAFVALGLMPGMAATYLYIRPCCPKDQVLSVRLTFAVSAPAIIPIRTGGLLILSFPADDAVTAISASSGSDDVSIDLDWMAAGEPT